VLPEHESFSLYDRSRVATPFHSKKADRNGKKRHNASLAVRYLLLFFYFYNVGNRTTVAMPLKAYEYVVVDLTVLQES